jgi:Leucine rich repeat/Leucine Rich repeat
MTRKSRSADTRPAGQTQRDPHPSRPKLDFRSIVIASLAVLAVVSFSVPMIRAGRQRANVERIWELGGYVERVNDHGDQLHRPPAWYRTLLGDNFMNPVLSIRLTETNVSDSDLARVARLSQLAFLDLTDTQITDSGVAHLSRLRHLEVLTLANTSVSDAGLSSLLPCTRLHSLDLEETRITDDGLNTLLGLENLQWLDLSGTHITDNGVRRVAHGRHLKTLILDGCDVSPEVIAELIAALPQLEINDATHRRPYWQLNADR